MTSDRLFVPICFSVLLFISGCSGVGGDVQAGRNALQTGRPNDAIGYLTRAAEADPNYKIPYRVRPGVLAYLGRAYLETGKDAEARQTLERAVSLDKDDPFAHLYLGIALLKTGERERGRKEVENGLRAIDDTLEYIAEDRVYGFFWDPGMQIRNDIRQSLAATRSLPSPESASVVSSTRRSTKRDATRHEEWVAPTAAAAGIDRPSPRFVTCCSIMHSCRNGTKQISNFAE